MVGAVLLLGAGPALASEAVPVESGAAGAAEIADAPGAGATGDPAATPGALRWIAVDASGAAVAGAVFDVQGPRDESIPDDGGEAQWATAVSATIADGSANDLDGEPASLMLQRFGADADPAISVDVRAGDTYRLRAAGDSEWQQVTAADPGAAATPVVVAAVQEPVEQEPIEEEPIEEEPMEGEPSAAEPEAPAPEGAESEPGRVQQRSVKDLRLDAQAGGTTTLRITKIGDRTGPGLTAGSPVPGATYEAYASTAGSSARPTGPSLGSCITNAQGICTITVPNAHPQGVWVRETASPAGWRAIGSLGTGAYDQGKAVTPYQFRVAVGTGSQNVTRNVTADRNLPSTSVSDAWVDVRDNPRFPEVCGISIAMVFDTSTSINGNEMTQFKNAAKNFVGASGLGGTPSRATMFSFSTTAGVLNGGTAYNLSVPGSAAGNSGYLGAAQRIQAGLPSQGDGFTNWDAALRLVQATGAYDMVLMLTDGDPTTYGPGTTTDTDVQFRMVEQAAMSANAIKATTGPSGSATKMLGVGVGLSANSHLNLQAITGLSEGNDYFLSSGFASLQQTLQQIATKNCASSVTVIKETRAADGTLIDDNAPGWNFTGQLDVPDRAPVAQTTTETGTNFSLVFPDTANRTFTVSEVQQPGFTFESARCTNAAGPVTQLANGFSVPVNGALITSCTIVNRQDPPTAELTLVKRVENAHGGTSDVDDWTLTGAGPSTISGKTGQPAVTRATVAPGTYALTESGGAGYAPSAWNCVDGATSLPVSAAGAFSVPNGGSVTCTITNRDLPGGVRWTKTSEIGGEVLAGSVWSITGPGPDAESTSITDCTSAPCTGPDVDPELGAFALEGLDWGDYTVTETEAPPGYVGGAEFAFAVTAENAGTIIDRGAITNAQQPGVALPLTGGLGSQLFTLGGLGIAAAAILTAFIAHRMRMLRARITASITPAL
ncbi:SpaA isopeptide-forming pilin-related protein [Leucobacter sp. USCH14]|uniref:SpaA isopeptide-forming pilin-related protein n=1 Tax=Leucobacter sp. USCH14 TaxID=3024838 RepID=UPI0030A56266